MNLAVTVGALTVLASAASLPFRAAQRLRTSPIPDISLKYGPKSWAVVFMDFPFNEDYPLRLADQGFNLLLVGDRFDPIHNYRNTASMEALKQKGVEVEGMEVDWSQQEQDLPFFEELQRKVGEKDVGVVVLPRVLAPR